VINNTGEIGLRRIQAVGIVVKSDRGTTSKRIKKPDESKTVAGYLYISWISKATPEVPDKYPYLKFRHTNSTDMQWKIHKLVASVNR